MKRFFALLALLVLIGCASFNATVFKTEKLATDSAYAAFKGWVAYYKTATNGAAPARIKVLNLRADAVNANVKNFALSVYTLDTLRESAVTNAAMKEPVLAALETVNLNASNIVWLVNHLRTKTN